MSDTQYAAKDLKEFGEEVNYRQKPSSDPIWQDSIVLAWWDTKNSIGGFHRLGHEPNLKEGPRVNLWTTLIGPRGVQKKVHFLPLRQADLLENGGWGSGDDTLRVEYINGQHIWTIKDTHTEARIIHTDIGPMVDCFPKKGLVSDAFMASHFDIPGKISGTVTLDGTKYDLDGYAVRDHGWGPRDWYSLYSHRWVGGAGPDLSFVACTWHSTDDSMVKFGWVIRDGKITPAKETDVLTYYEADGMMTRGGHIKLTLTTDEVLDIECTPIPVPASLSYARGGVCVDRFCTWTCGEMNGTCDFETSSNRQQGTGRPESIRGGVINDGWHPLK